MTRRHDPIFSRPTPLLFAHRGGAREVAESTELGFRHAIACGSDVLELDVQLTRGKHPDEQEIVIWHGPDLDNVRLAADRGLPHQRRRRKITEYEWSELDGQAWVADPGTRAEDIPFVPQDANRRLLTLRTFLTTFPAALINIELKSVTRDHLERFLEVLSNGNPNRIGVIASNHNGALLRAVSRLSAGKFHTNLATPQLILCRLAAAVGLARFLPLRGRAVEVPHPRWFFPRRVVRQVQAAGGVVYVFLTAIPFVKALDSAPGSPDRAALFEILDRGVDGIMTDRPARAREIIDEWVAQHKSDEPRRQP